MFYLLFKEYSEYNQFEGSWDKNWRSFDTLDEANTTKYAMESSADYCEVSPVLTELSQA